MTDNPPKNDGMNTISSETTHKVIMSTGQAPNMVCHDPTNMRVIAHIKKK